MLLLAVCEVIGGVVVSRALLDVFVPFCLLGSVLSAVGLHALGLAQHESFHRLLFRTRRLNDVAGRLLCSWVLFTQYSQLKRAHLAHHRNFGAPDDPDFWHWDRNGSGRKSKKLLFEVLFFRRLWISMVNNRAVGRDLLRNGELAYVVLVQVVILLAIVSTAGPVVYAVGWLLPLFSIMPLLEHIRVVAEHHGSSLRVFLSPNPLEYWVFGRFGFAFHGYHHQNPRLHWFGLSRVSSATEPLTFCAEKSRSWVGEFMVAMRR